MKVYLNDEKQSVDPWLLYDILWGFKALCAMPNELKTGLWALSYSNNVTLDFCQDQIERNQSYQI